MIKTLLRTLAVTGAAVCAVSGIANAQSNSLKADDAIVSNPGMLLESLHAEAIVPVLDELGIQYQGASLENGQKVILAQAPNGVKFNLTPVACDKAGKRCRGLNMVALFQTSAPDRVVAAFNYRYAFISAGVDDSGIAYISRYDIADYGMPRGNLAVSLANYLHMAKLFDRHLYEATNTVRLDASDTDLAANGLNMNAILADTGLAQTVGLDMASHEVSFESIPGIVDTFISADKLSPGRLINQVNGQR